MQLTCDDGATHYMKIINELCSWLVWVWAMFLTRVHSSFTHSDFCEPYLFLYRHVLPCFCSTVAWSIDGVLGVGDEETRRMSLAREAAATAAVGDVPEPTCIPSFLMHNMNTEKRPRIWSRLALYLQPLSHLGGFVRATLSPKVLISLWSDHRHFITPTDHATLIRSGGGDWWGRDA